MTLSVPEQILSKMILLLESEETVSRGLVFGSRCRGDNKPNSDIDLALEGKNIPLRLNTRLRDVAGLYKLDIVHLENLDNNDLLLEIINEGQVIFERKN